MPSGFRKQRAVSALDTAHRFSVERPPSAPICQAFSPGAPVYLSPAWGWRSPDERRASSSFNIGAADED